MCGVVGVGLLPRVSVGLGGYQTDMRVIGALGFPVVVLVDRFLFFGFSGASGYFGSAPLVWVVVVF